MGLAPKSSWSQLIVYSEALWDGKMELLMEMTELDVMTKIFRLGLSLDEESKRSLMMSWSSILHLLVLG